jgi:hypothetical protein
LKQAQPYNLSAGEEIFFKKPDGTFVKAYIRLIEICKDEVNDKKRIYHKIYFETNKDRFVESFYENYTDKLFFEI